MSQRVLLHVGTPKTGTSYLQEVLYRNREALRQHGLLYPAERFDAHFLAALDLMRMPWGGLQTEAIGAWDVLAAQVRDHPGTAVISHEILATASRQQAARALASVGHTSGGQGTEVHVVLSVRDLVRQIPAEWQENVKHRSGVSYQRFLDRVRDPDRSGRMATWFWGVQEIPDILDRWGHDLPPERIHVVTVPPPGGPPDLLWQRFEHAFGLAGLGLDLDIDRSNPSLGVPETALIRRINRISNRELHPPDYRPLVRELVAHQTLSRRTGSPRLALPPDVHPWVQEISRSWVQEVAARGYDVVGDLDDLIGAPVTPSFEDPDAPREEQVADAALDAVKALLLDNARLRAQETRLHEQLHETRRALERSYLRPTYRAREQAVRVLETSGPGQRVLGLYRGARGRSSRSA